MNYGAFTNDSLTMMYEGIRGALAADDALKAGGEEPRFRVRATSDWKRHAADLEVEMLRRGLTFDIIDLVRRSGHRMRATSVLDAVDGSSTGTGVPWMWALLRLP